MKQRSEIILFVFIIFILFFSKLIAEGIVIEQENETSIWDSNFSRAYEHINITSERDKRTEDTLHYDGSNFTGMGLFPYPIAAVRFTPESAGTLIAVIFYYYEDITHNVSANVYEEGTPTHPGSLVIVESYSVTGQGWHRIDLSSSYPYSAGVDFWTAIEMVDYIGPEYPFGVDAGPAEDGRGDWISSDAGATWNELQWWGLDYNWNIRAIVHLEGGGVEEASNYQFSISSYQLSISPNPFTKEVEIRMQIPEIKKIENRNSPISQFPISLCIYDVSGRSVRSFSLTTDHSALVTAVSWDGRDNKGREVKNGIYFCRLTAGGYQVAQKIIKLY